MSERKKRREREREPTTEKMCVTGFLYNKTPPVFFYLSTIPTPLLLSNPTNFILVWRRKKREKWFEWVWVAATTRRRYLETTWTWSERKTKTRRRRTLPTTTTTFSTLSNANDPALKCVGILPLGGKKRFLEKRKRRKNHFQLRATLRSRERELELKQ